MSSSLFQQVLIPVGQPLGAVHRADPADTLYRIRLGDAVYQIAPYEGAMWNAAHALGSRGIEGCTVDDLIAAAENNAAAAPTVDFLVELGLLIPVALWSGGIDEFLDGFRVCALMHGIGNAPDRLDAFGFGIGDDGFGVAPPVLSELVNSAGAHRSMRSQIREMHDALGSLGVPKTLDELAVETLRELHSLLAVHAIYYDLAILDRATTGESR